MTVVIEKLSRAYESHGNIVNAVVDVSATFPSSSMIAVKGKSGAGKTTLLNLIGGLDEPTSGSIVIDDIALGTLSDKELTVFRRKRIGFIFQSFALEYSYTVAENVEMVLRISGLPTQEVKDLTRKSLIAVGLDKYLDFFPDELSGGQQQRLAIARAIAKNPDLILADEPTAELDTVSSRAVFSLLRKLIEENKTTVIVTSHDPLVDEYADITLNLLDGQIQN